MVNYIIKRIFAGLLTMFVLVTISFFLMRSIPGGPFNNPEDKNIPQSIIEMTNERYGLNAPLREQYVRYLKTLLKGDLGYSFILQNTKVNDIIIRGFPATAKVGMLAVLISVIMGTAVGVVSAIYRGKLLDWIVMLFVTLGISIPSFISAVLLLYVFSGWLDLLPSFGLSDWKSFILPVAGLALSPIATIARLTRSSMPEVIRQDYIRTARAKGVTEFFVIMKHGLKNAILPVITYLGPLIAALLTGSFVIERLFSIPGIGREYVVSVSDRDYAVLLGMTIFFGGLIIISNIFVDIIYAAIDPRIKIDK